MVGSGIYTSGSFSVPWENIHAFTYVQYMLALTHTHINTCASINDRLGYFTSLCMAPYVKPSSFPLHRMHTVFILLGDITVHGVQGLAGTKVYFLENGREFLKYPPPLP